MSLWIFTVHCLFSHRSISKKQNDHFQIPYVYGTFPHWAQCERKMATLWIWSLMCQLGTEARKRRLLARRMKERKRKEMTSTCLRKKNKPKKKTTPLLTFSYLGFAITSSSGSFEQIYHRTYHIAQTWYDMYHNYTISQLQFSALLDSVGVYPLTQMLQP